MTLTYVDSCVLMWAARGTDDLALRAMAILDDPERTFASGIFVKLETLPKPRFTHRDEEVHFYETFFASCKKWVHATRTLCETALEEGERRGLSAVDSLHVVSAAKAGATELVTTEKLTKPIHKTTLVKVRCISES